MTDRTIISAGKYDDDRIYLISTDGTKNQIDLYDGESNSLLISWSGVEVSSSCFHQGTFALTTFDSLIYIIENDKIREMNLDGYYLNTISFQDKKNLLGAGNKGRLYRLNLTASSIMEEKLSSFGVSKPGRDFISSSYSEKGNLFFGKKRLLIEIKNKTIKDIGCISSGEEFYFSATERHDDIWVAGLKGPKALLVNYSNGASYVYDAPTENQRAPIILILNNKLLVGNQKIFSGKPDNWTLIHDFGENTLISMIVLPSKPNKVFCIGYTGKIDQINI
jgi:hypothetical protein